MKNCMDSKCRAYGQQQEEQEQQEKQEQQHSVGAAAERTREKQTLKQKCKKEFKQHFENLHGFKMSDFKKAGNELHQVVNGWSD